MKSALSRLRASRPWRAWKRYAEARGNILSAGVGYFAFFSIFPATALALTVFGFVLRGHPDLLHSIFDQLGAYLPGLVKDAQHPDGLIPVEPPQAMALTITGVVALVTLVMAGLGWLGAVREGIRAVFGAPGSSGKLVMKTVRDLGVLVTLGLGIAILSVVTSAASAAAGWVADVVGLPGQVHLVVLAGFAVSVVADTGLMIILLRVVSGVRAPWRDLFQGALVGGVGFSLLKISAASLLPRLTANPVFASFAIVVGLLVWLNLIARLTLISAAWAANDVEQAHGGEPQARIPAPRQDLDDRVAETTPQTIAQTNTQTDTQTSTQTSTSTGSTAVRDAALPSFSGSSRDRTTLLSGVVLGAAAMTATAGLARAMRSLVRVVKS